MQDLNSDWFSKYGQSGSINENMKAVAYMLDRDIWTLKFTGNEKGNGQVEYAVGGPSIEQIINSYNKKFGTQAKTSADSLIGYSVKDTSSSPYAPPGGLDYGSKYLPTEEFGPGTYAYIASPYGVSEQDLFESASNFAHLAIRDLGGAFNDEFFRPVLCLDSSVELVPLGDESFKIEY